MSDTSVPNSKPVPNGHLLSPAERAEINRANAQSSTGPRTETGKQRSSLNALHHGLTARTAVLPSQDAAAFERHTQQFLDEYRPATPTETHLVNELANTAWRLKRIPLLEADLLTRAADPSTSQAAIDFDIVDAHRLLANLGLHGHRLSRQFERTLVQLRQIQAERRETETQQLKKAADLLNMHEKQNLPYDPAEDGFVFTKDEVATFLRRRDRDQRAYQFKHCANGFLPASASTRDLF